MDYQVFDPLFKDLLKYIYIPDNFSFECKRCNNCCTKEPGLVFLCEADIENLCRGLSLSREEIEKKFLREYNDFPCLKEKTNFDCIFWEGNNKFEGCSIYDFKPFQCTTFPYWLSVFLTKRNFQEELIRCPGLMNGNKIISSKKIIELIYKDFLARKNWYNYLYGDDFL